MTAFNIFLFSIMVLTPLTYVISRHIAGNKSKEESTKEVEEEKDSFVVTLAKLIKRVREG